ncbi:MAG: type IV pilus secretin PilQ [Burkholderiaceae bacterium]|jgi:type IV pilus assembly protein PilQ
MNKNIFSNGVYGVIGATVISLTACSNHQPLAKRQVLQSANKSRDSVEILRENNPAPVADLNSDLSKRKEKDIVEIRTKSQDLKFTDARWDNFPISLELNAVPLRTVFDIFQKISGVNIVVGNEVKGELTLQMSDVDWVELLQLILRNENLLSEVNQKGNIVTIHSAQFIAQQSELIQKALGARYAASKAYASTESKATAIIKLDYSKPEVMAQQLKDIIAALEPTQTGGQQSSGNSSRASFVVDARTNSLIVQSSEQDLEWIKAAIISLDKATRQVLVEVYIVEATDDFQYQLGSRIGAFKNLDDPRAQVTGTLAGTPPVGAGTITTAVTAGSIANNPVPGLSTGGGIVSAFQLDGADIRVQLEGMQRDSLIKIVSNPKLFILDNEVAEIADGQEVPYATQAQLGATPSIQFKEASLKMKVQPSVIGDGNVYLNLEVNKDTPLTGTPPPIAKKQLKTKLLVRDGGIAMIGGITKSEESAERQGVPFFGTLPILGNLFKFKRDVNNKNQLYIFLAPKVL